MKYAKFQTSTNRPSSLFTSLEYTRCCNRAYKASVEKNFETSLKYYNLAEAIMLTNGGSGVTNQDALARADVKRKLQMYSDSIKDVRDTIPKIKQNEYSEHNRRYLLYYAGRVGALSESENDNPHTDQAILKLSNLTKFGPDQSKVSRSILRKLPLTN